MYLEVDTVVGVLECPEHHLHHHQSHLCELNLREKVIQSDSMIQCYDEK